MKKQLKKGDKIKLLESQQLFELFNLRRFFSDDFRKEAAEKLGGKEGIVSGIEDRYAFDYFFFLSNDGGTTWSIPYESVEFN